MPLADAVLYRLIALNAYAAYRNVLSGGMSPWQNRRFDRISHPQPGDLVLELTTIWTWLDTERTPGAALGFLRELVEAPVIDADALAAMHAAGEYFQRPDETLADIPTEPVYHIEPLDGTGTVRWRNASFIQVATEPADVTHGD